MNEGAMSVERERLAKRPNALFPGRVAMAHLSSVICHPDELKASSASHLDGLAPPSKEQGKTSFSVRGQRVNCDCMLPRGATAP
jgi:hypothetical protein